MAELTDEDRRRGALRMLALRERIGERRANLMLGELATRMLDHGFEPTSDAIMRVVGGGTDGDWAAACARIPEVSDG